MSQSLASPLPPKSPLAAHGRTGATVAPSRSFSRPAASSDGLTPLQRRGLVLFILALHGVAGWGLMQVREVRDAVALAAPMFVDLIAPELPPSPALPSPPPPPPPMKPVLRKPPPPAPMIAAAPAPETVAFTAPPPPPEAPPVVVEVPPPTPVVLAAPPAPPAPPPAPRLIPASAVQYLEPPAVQYPRASRRAGEAGRVLLRVYIDESGLPRQVLVSRSSGFSRLDEAAVSAMQRARFKPYTENGQPTAGWAPALIDFELEP